MPQSLARHKFESLCADQKINASIAPDALLQCGKALGNAVGAAYMSCIETTHSSSQRR
jgi:hypothetical protein